MQDYKIYRIGGWAKLGAVWTGLQDYKIYRIGGWAKLGAKNGQDGRISGLTG